MFFRAPTSSSLISTLLSADTPLLSASVWFPSCCSNLFMLNLDLQSLAREAFAFSNDLCCCFFFFKGLCFFASEYWDFKLNLQTFFCGGCLSDIKVVSGAWSCIVEGLYKSQPFHFQTFLLDFFKTSFHAVFYLPNLCVAMYFRQELPKHNTFETCRAVGQ